MQNYLNTPFDMDDKDLASAYDEIPFWSPPFGELIFQNIEMRPRMTVLDIGFGTGYPMIELAGRLGKSSTVYGIDMWNAGTVRARFKAKTLGVDNVVFVAGDAASTDFEDDQFDLIVSNVGINNFEKPQDVFFECYRIAKKGAQVAFTTNPKGHMREFYAIFRQTLTALKLESVLLPLEEHENHRHGIEAINKMLTESGFSISKNQKDSFTWRFLDGTSFLNHHMIRRGFVGGWKSIIPPDQQTDFFDRLENNINAIAREKGSFTVTIPTAYIEARK